MIERLKKTKKTPKKPTLIYLGLFWNNFSEIIFVLSFFIVADNNVLEMGKYEASPSASFNFWVAIWLCNTKVFPSFILLFFFPLLFTDRLKKSSTRECSWMNYAKTSLLSSLENFCSYTFCYVWFCAVKPKIHHSPIIQIFLAFLGRFQDVAILLASNFWLC